MRAFLQQVSGSEDLAESGLKVIAYFDALVEHRATLEACVRAAAALSQCTAGLRDSTSSLSVRFTRRGVAVEGAAKPAISRPVRIGDRDVGAVWLEREGGYSALDELIVERMASAAGVLWRGSPRPRVSAAALIETVVSSATTSEDRGRALALLRLASEGSLDVMAVSAAATEDVAAGLGAVRQAVQERSREGDASVVCAELVGAVGIVLAQPGLKEPLEELPLSGLAAGVVSDAAAERLSDAWVQAQTAAQFSGLLGFGAVVNYDELGSLALLAGLSADTVSTNRDVLAVSEMTRTNRGRAALEALERRLASGSVRETAAALYLHHSSVRYRLRHAEEYLDVGLDDPQGRLRAELAVLLWRLTSD
jgi:hypothetical protein